MAKRKKVTLFSTVFNHFRMIHVGTINISNWRKYFQYLRIKHGTLLHFEMTSISNKTLTSWLIPLIPGHSLWLSLPGPGHSGQSQNSGNNIAGLMWTLTNRSAGQLGVTWQNFIQCKIRAQGYNRILKYLLNWVLKKSIQLRCYLNIFTNCQS